MSLIPGSMNAQVLWEDDLSSISGTITSAKLKLKCNGDKGNGTINIALGNSNSWTETNSSSSNKPTSKRY